MKTIYFIFKILAITISTIILTAKSATIERQKRSGISDQRLAELETLLALSRMKGKLVTVPVAFGVIDPDKIGKRKRAHLESPYEMSELDDDADRNDWLWISQLRDRFNDYPN